MLLNQLMKLEVLNIKNAIKSIKEERKWEYGNNGGNNKMTEQKTYDRQIYSCAQCGKELKRDCFVRGKNLHYKYLCSERCVEEYDNKEDDSR